MLSGDQQHEASRQSLSLAPAASALPSPHSPEQVSNLEAVALPCLAAAATDLRVRRIYAGIAAQHGGDHDREEAAVREPELRLAGETSTVPNGTLVGRQGWLFMRHRVRSARGPELGQLPNFNHYKSWHF